MKNDRIKNGRIKSDLIKSGRIKSDRIKTDRIKRITDPIAFYLVIPLSCLPRQDLRAHCCGTGAAKLIFDFCIVCSFTPYCSV
jgi:hypothetical protein